MTAQCIELRKRPWSDVAFRDGTMPPDGKPSICIQEMEPCQWYCLMFDTGEMHQIVLNLKESNTSGIFAMSKAYGFNTHIRPNGTIASRCVNRTIRSSNNQIQPTAEQNND